MSLQQPQDHLEDKAAANCRWSKTYILFKHRNKAGALPSYRQ